MRQRREIFLAHAVNGFRIALRTEDHVAESYDDIQKELNGMQPLSHQ
jgi:hypothetical protein